MEPPLTIQITWPLFTVRSVLVAVLMVDVQEPVVHCATAFVKEKEMAKKKQAAYHNFFALRSKAFIKNDFIVLGVFLDF